MSQRTFEERARAEVERIKGEERAKEERFQARLEELREDARRQREAEAERERQEKARRAQQREEARAAEEEREKRTVFRSWVANGGAPGDFEAAWPDLRAETLRRRTVEAESAARGASRRSAHSSI